MPCVGFSCDPGPIPTVSVKSLTWYWSGPVLGLGPIEGLSKYAKIHHLKLWRNHVDSVPKLCDDYTALLCILVVNYAEHERWVPALKMYRSIFLVILCCLLLGINTYGWRSSGVNHVLIFELDPRNHLTHSELLEVRKLRCESKLAFIAKVGQEQFWTSEVKI